MRRTADGFRVRLKEPPLSLPPPPPPPPPPPVSRRPRSPSLVDEEEEPPSVEHDWTLCFESSIACLTSAAHSRSKMATTRSSVFALHICFVFTSVAMFSAVRQVPSERVAVSARRETQPRGAWHAGRRGGSETAGDWEAERASERASKSESGEVQESRGARGAHLRSGLQRDSRSGRKRARGLWCAAARAGRRRRASPPCKTALRAAAT